jgi:dienelactone hydrolase
MKRALVALVVAMLASPVAAVSVERVRFPSLDHDANGQATTIQGFVIAPSRKPPRGGFPAIVALHGCAGLYSVQKGRENDLADRLKLRAKLYNDEGYAVLFPDSFGARGMREVCTVPVGQRTITAYRRRLDALGALAYLSTRRDIAHERVAVVGWSHGASTAVNAINGRDAEVAHFQATHPAEQFFRAAIAFYPGCRVVLAAGDEWQASVPLRIHIGELDDWTPAAPCVALADGSPTRGDDVKTYTYADSYHGFDAPIGKLMHRTDVPNGVRPGEGVHVGPNPKTRALANARVLAFLRERMR